MRLTITPEAKEKLKMINQKAYHLLLWYDTEDCGCGVNGMPTVCLINQKKPMYKEIENDTYSTLVHEQQAIFFAKNMTLDIVGGMFRLSSPEGILNPFISPSRLIENI